MKTCGTPPSRNPTLTATAEMLILMYGLSNLNDAKNRKLKVNHMTERNIIMEELAKVISKFESIELLVAEIRAGENVETVEELTEYLESELSYAAE